MSYMKQMIEEEGEIIEFSNDLRYSEVPEYSPRLHLRYTPLQSHRLLLEELSLPFVSYLRKLTSGESLFSNSIEIIFLSQKYLLL